MILDGKDVQRFMSMVSMQPSGCWLWTGALNGKNKYGRFWFAGRTRQATHFAVTLIGVTLPLPRGFEPDHLCRQPNCVNPLHLEVVTCKENVRRSESPLGVNSRKTHCNHGHLFDTANTAVYVRHGHAHRRCRQCSRARADLRWQTMPERMRAHKRAQYARKIALVGRQRRSRYSV